MVKLYQRKGVRISTWKCILQKSRFFYIVPANVDTRVCSVILKGKGIEIARKTILLGITIDDQVKFEEHIAYRKLKI